LIAGDHGIRYPCVRKFPIFSDKRTAYPQTVIHSQGASAMSRKSRVENRLEHHEVAARAYEIFLMEDRPGDHALEHWLRAERELMNRSRRIKSRAAMARQESVPQVSTRSVNPIDAWCGGLDDAA